MFFKKYFFSTPENLQSKLNHPQLLHYSEYFHFLEFPKNQDQFKANGSFVRFDQSLNWYQVFHNNIILSNYLYSYIKYSLTIETKYLKKFEFITWFKLTNFLI